MKVKIRKYSLLWWLGYVSLFVGTILVAGCATPIGW